MPRTRHTIASAALALCLLSGAAAARAEEPGLAERIGLKLARGAANFCTGWVELPKQMYLVTHERGWLIGLTRGTFEGLGMLGARTVAGAYEVLTFPLPIPPHYQPLMQPDYVWQPEPPAAPAPDAAPAEPDQPAPEPKP
jgi:putative exosortase-associated protein (TIGR04073 family)